MDWPADVKKSFCKTKVYFGSETIIARRRGKPEQGILCIV
jgi:hypothetical protein